MIAVIDNVHFNIGKTVTTVWSVLDKPKESVTVLNDTCY